jgi:hypothetical protein
MPIVIRLIGVNTALEQLMHQEVVAFGRGVAERDGELELAPS